MHTNDARRRKAVAAAAGLTAAATIAGGGLALLGAPAATAAPTCAAPTQPIAPGAADFDGDGVADAAYGEPTRRTGGNAKAGAVRIAQSCAADTTLTGVSVGFLSQAGSRWGATVTAAKVNGDKYTDLIVSAPGQNKVGVIVAVFGSADGLGKGLARQRITVPNLRAGDRFGESVLLTTTYVDAAGLPEVRRHLVVGAPGSDIGATNAGAVYDLKLAAASTPGPTPTATATPTATVTSTASPTASPAPTAAPPVTVASTTRWVQGEGGVPGAPETGDQFGEALSAGAVAAPSSPAFGATTIAIGVPHEDVGKVADAGSLFVVSGLGLNRVTSISRSTAGVPGVARTGDLFGHSVLGKGNAFYVGTPGEDVGKARDAGSVQRAKVDAAGKLRVSAARTQNSAGVGGTSESGDRLGTSLTLVSAPALAVNIASGAPGEDVSGRTDAGGVSYLAFDAACTTACKTYTQNSPGYAGAAESGDRFGQTLTSVGNSAAPVPVLLPLIGVPGEDVAGRTDAGTLGGAVTFSPITSGPSAGEHLGEVAPALFIR